MFQLRLKGVLSNFKGVSRVFEESLKGCFKSVSMKFCFAILFLHGSHRSYPSRRRACFNKTQFKFPTPQCCLVQNLLSAIVGLLIEASTERRWQQIYMGDTQLRNMSILGWFVFSFI